MRIDDRVEALVRAVLDAAVHRDADRFDSALDAVGHSQETLTKAVELTLAINAAVLFEVHDDQPSREQVNELSRSISHQEKWAEASAGDVQAVLVALTTGDPQPVTSNSGGPAAVFVVAANLLATASQPAEGEWWFRLSGQGGGGDRGRRVTVVPEPAQRDGGELDGFHIGHLPSSVGDLVSDFTSEWEDVTFATRVWERQVEDGHRVDLRVHVLRGDRLGTLAELRDFLAEYHERDSASWVLTEFQHGADPGSTGSAEVFWLSDPGVAVNVLIDPERFTTDTLLAIANGIAVTAEDP